MNTPRQSKVLQYNAVFRPEPEGGYTVFVPSLPGCITYGKDAEEAREMAKDAILGYLAVLKKNKEPIPNDSDGFVASVQIKYKPGRKRQTYA